MGFEPILTTFNVVVLPLHYIWFLTVDVLLREGPFPFGLQNASHQRMLSVCGLITISLYPITCRSFSRLRGYRPQPQNLGLISLQLEPHARYHPFYLPVLCLLSLGRKAGM